MNDTWTTTCPDVVELLPEPDEPEGTFLLLDFPLWIFEEDIS